MIKGDVVVEEIRLRRPPDAVFDFFVDPGKLVRWIGIGVDLDPRPGGRFRFEVAPGQYCEGAYVEFERPLRVAFTWGWTDPGMGVPPGSSRVDVELAPDGDGTRLRLVHRGLAPDARLLHDDGWGRFLARLLAVVAGAAPPSYPTGDPAARLDELRLSPSQPEAARRVYLAPSAGGAGSLPPDGGGSRGRPETPGHVPDPDGRARASDAGGSGSGG